MFIRVGCALLAAVTVSGCSSGSSSATQSGFVTVTNGSADINVDQRLGNSITNANVGLVSYAAGIDNDQIRAASGIQAGANVGTPVTTGTATYDAQYGYVVVDRITRTDTFIRGNQDTSSINDITLTADFDAGTLTGANTTASDQLSVNSTISGDALSGTARLDYSVQGAFRGAIDTEVTGQIGSTGVIGAFQGSDDNTVAAGGFVGTRR